jgi:alkylation response protein AidB-like acyl-CoA dehydrogenase
MDFSWTDQQASLYAAAVKVGREKLNPACRGRRGQASFGFEEWKGLGEFGALGLCLPREYGGLGVDAQTTARTLEGLARGYEDTGILFAAAAHLFAVAKPIAMFGTPAQKSDWLPSLASGAWIAANAITEAEAGSDVMALQTRAEREGEGYVLSGAKTYVTNGPEADVYLVYAKTAPEDGYLGISAFLVPKGTRGAVVGAPFPKTGLKSAHTSSLYLDGCKVPAGARLGGEGLGGTIFRSSMLWERACLFAIFVGALDRQLAEAINYTRARKQFSKPLSEFQAVAHRLADVKIRLESARLLLYRACWALDTEKDPELAIAISKVAVVDAAVASGIDLILSHGGQGVMSETGVDALLCNALPATAFSGTADIQKGIIARALYAGKTA